MANDRGIAQHPAVVHLHIHAMEMANNPETAMASADALATLSPDSGHLNHMPGHIYVLCGDYEKARLVSRKALRANDMFLAYAGPFTYYTVACCHDLHLMMHTSMFLGRYADAIAAADKMCGLLTKEVLSVKDRPKFTMSLGGLLLDERRTCWCVSDAGRTSSMSRMPDDPQLYLVTTAMHHYAKGIAHAALKNFREAEKQRRLFDDSLRRMPATRRFFNNMAHDVFGVAEKMLDGELQYHLGQPRRRLRASARERAPRRQPQLHRALGLDAPPATRAGGPPDGAGTLRRGRADLSRRPGPEREDPALRAAS